MFDTVLARRLGIPYPILLAPMAGGPSTPELAAAVSRAGGLGAIATGYQSPDQIRTAIRRVRELTDRPFAANLLVAESVQTTPAQLARADELLAPLREELGLEATPMPSLDEPFEEQIATLLEARVPVVSFTFGILKPEAIEAFKRQGTLLAGTATSVAEARALEAAGVDCVVAQGMEAGGHRGTFIGPAEASLVGTMALVPQVVDAVSIPVVAAGGIMDGRGLVAAFALGAAGVQMGTAFLRCPEAGTNAPHRHALGEVNELATRVTRAFSGKAVRGIDNRLSKSLAPYVNELPGYPALNALTRDLRRKAIELERPDLMGMWAGQGSPLARAMPAGELIEAWVVQARAILARL